MKAHGRGAELPAHVFGAGWPLRAAATVAETPAPTAAELAMIRRFDPDGFWTRGRG